MSETPDDDEQLTETAKTRWEWLSTFSAALLIVSFIGAVAALTADPVPATWPGGPVGWVYLAGFLAALTYAIGEDVTKVYQSLRDGSSP